mgnify:FL=1|jgi:hypothetical protein
MGIIKRAGDLVYTFRFLRLLTMRFEDTEAFKLGIIDADGKRLKSYELNTMQEREDYSNYYTPFHRLVFNIKKLMAKAPGGGSRLASYAAALYLIKEKYNVNVNKAIKESGIDPLDFMTEQSLWFVLEDGRLSPGTYKVTNDKVLNNTLEEMVKTKDTIKVKKDCYPIGQMFGLNVYEATHIKTGQNIYVTVSELSV